MTRPSIGVFDSGVGGLSVLREIQQKLPNESLLYFADQRHVPYGSRSLDDVQALSEGITRFLLEQGCKLVVVACNTASAAALYTLRSSFPAVPFVGMEPAIKPAAERSETRKVAVLATPATFQGALFDSVVERFARGVEVIEIIAPGLVELVEAGQTASEAVDAVLLASLEPAKSREIDTLVLACTHYSFVIPTIRRILGPSVSVIDPAPAIASQTDKLWGRQIDVVSTQPGTSIRYITSGDPNTFRASLFKLIGDEVNAQAASWEAGSLILHGN
ncbi:MAG: glutamate racemase [Anaerolineales bacterium]